MSGSVVVGLDQSPGAKAALDWAADEARLRGAPSRIAHSWDHMDYELPEAVSRTIGESAFRAAAMFLDDTATQVRAAHPGLKVDTALLSEAPSEGLIGLTEEAALVVVGRRGPNSVLTTRSVSGAASAVRDDRGRGEGVVQHRVSGGSETGGPFEAAAAERASLLVLGRHRRHARYGLPLGRFPHRVLHLSDLPVAVVPN